MRPYLAPVVAILLVVAATIIGSQLAREVNTTIGDSVTMIEVDRQVVPVESVEQSVERATIQERTWHGLTALSTAMGGLAGLAGYVLLVRSPTTRRAAIGSLLVFGAFVWLGWWLVSPPTQVLLTQSGQLHLDWTIRSPAFTASATLVGLGTIVRAVRSWKSGGGVAAEESERVRAV